MTHACVYTAVCVLCMCVCVYRPLLVLSYGQKSKIPSLRSESPAANDDRFAAAEPVSSRRKLDAPREERSGPAAGEEGGIRLKPQAGPVGSVESRSLSYLVKKKRRDTIAYEYINNARVLQQTRCASFGEIPGDRSRYRHFNNGAAFRRSE